MVAITNLLHSGLLLVNQAVYQDVATPQQASTDQYNIVRYLAGSGPYIQRPGYGIATEIPDQCQLEQVHLLSRHGERYPSKNKGKKFEELYAKFRKQTKPFVGELAFLNDYEYFVLDKEYYEKETTPANSEGLYAGTSDALNHGTTFRSKYNDLYNSSEELVVFTSNSGRVHVTSKYFARGFLGDDYNEKNVKFNVLAEEKEMGANSLTPNIGCKAYEKDYNSSIAKEYDTSFLDDAAKRITKGNDLNLTLLDVFHLFEWCAYEINVRGLSPFCNLFTKDEFVKYSYGEDLTYYYRSGPGNNATRDIGAPFWKASLKYLKEENPENKIVLLFTHDTHIEILHAALGVVAPKEDLPTDHIPFPVPYSHVLVVPMGSRTYTEKYNCGGESYVRFVLNDAVVPIESCQSGPGFSCKLSDYEKYLESRLAGTDYKSQCDNGKAPNELTFLWDYNSKNYTAPDINK